MKSFLDEAPADAFPAFLDRCRRAGADAALIERVTRETFAFQKTPTPELARGQVLETRWYDSLARKAPDFSVYDEDAYLAELWTCWAIYSRGYLRGIQRNHLANAPETTIQAAIGSPSRVLDLGCGCGYSTAGLRELFPDADVVGTNLDGTTQTRVARDVAAEHNVRIVSSVREAGGRAELVFASEYFEHIPDPIADLNEVLTVLRPTDLLVANAFGTRGLGHFSHYRVRGEWLDARSTSKLFQTTLKLRGYRKIKTNFWNDRPTYWRKVG